MIFALLILLSAFITGPNVAGDIILMGSLAANFNETLSMDESDPGEDNIPKDLSYEEEPDSPVVIDYMSSDLLDSEAASYENRFEIIYTEDVPDSIKNTVEEYTSMIPAVILEDVADNGFIYTVDPSGTTTKDHAGMTIFPDCTVDGVFLHTKDNHTPPDGKIAIMGDTVSRTKMAAIHEVGHAVDFIIGAAYGYSTTFENETYMSMEGDPEWQKIFAEENEIADFPDYNRTCPLEYFAEVFRYVFEDPSKLDNIPKSRDYVISLLESYYGISIN